MGAVDGIARLETRDALPAVGGDAGAQLPRRQAVGAEGKVVGKREGLYLARY